MTEQRQAPVGEERGIPRDLPDQQAGADGEDDYRPAGDSADEDASVDVPDTDEAGTGRRGAPRSARVDPEQPTPDEPAD